MPDVITPEDRRLIDAALPRKKVILQGVSGAPEATSSWRGKGSKRNDTAARVQRKAAQRALQKRVLALWAAGKTVRDIARELGRSETFVAAEVRALKALGLVGGVRRE